MSHFSVIKGLDGNGLAQPIGVTGVGQDELKIYDAQTFLLQDLLVQMKITNQYLKQIVGESNEVVESDVEVRG